MPASRASSTRRPSSTVNFGPDAQPPSQSVASNRKIKRMRSSLSAGPGRSGRRFPRSCPLRVTLASTEPHRCVVAADTVAALGLGGIQGPVGLAEQAVQVDQVARFGTGDAEAGGQLQGRAVGWRDRRAGQLGAQPLGEPHRLVRPAVGRQDDELFTTVAGQQLAVANLGAREFRRRAQHGVTNRVAVQVVDMLEVVQVEDDEGDRPAVAACLRKQPGGTLDKGAAVRQASQEVGVAGHAQLLDQPLTLQLQRPAAQHRVAQRRDGALQVADFVAAGRRRQPAVGQVAAAHDSAQRPRAAQQRQQHPVADQQEHRQLDAKHRATQGRVDGHALARQSHALAGLVAGGGEQGVAQLDDALHRRHVAGHEGGAVEAVGLAVQAAFGEGAHEGQAHGKVARLHGLDGGLQPGVGMAGARLQVDQPAQLLDAPHQQRDLALLFTAKPLLGGQRDGELRAQTPGVFAQLRRIPCTDQGHGQLGVDGLRRSRLRRDRAEQGVDDTEHQVDRPARDALVGRATLDLWQRGDAVHLGAGPHQLSPRLGQLGTGRDRGGVVRVIPGGVGLVKGRIGGAAELVEPLAPGGVGRFGIGQHRDGRPPFGRRLLRGLHAQVGALHRAQPLLGRLDLGPVGPDRAQQQRADERQQQTGREQEQAGQAHGGQDGPPLSKRLNCPLAPQAPGVRHECTRSAAAPAGRRGQRVGRLCRACLG
mmetsp:Transcript_67535/g.187133  ORF Transcript_67535/g.187133 Transcript_67535/m.187133 type:complete len:705 (+) Transcript_67535:27-2141(+)